MMAERKEFLAKYKNKTTPVKRRRLYGSREND